MVEITPPVMVNEPSVHNHKQFGNKNPTVSPDFEYKQ